jgi:hypothetical protein
MLTSYTCGLYDAAPKVYGPLEVFRPLSTNYPKIIKYLNEDCEKLTRYSSRYNLKSFSWDDIQWNVWFLIVHDIGLLI